jgi:hypothetical protein
LNSFFKPYFFRPDSVAVAAKIVKSVKTMDQPPPVGLRGVVLLVWCYWWLRPDPVPSDSITHFTDP